MPLDVDTGNFQQYDDDLKAIMRLQDVLLEAAQGARDSELDEEYKVLRRALLSDHTYAEVVPSLVRGHRDLRSMWPVFKDLSPHWEPRREEVRRQFEPTLAEAERLEIFGTVKFGDSIDAEIKRAIAYDSSAWTGATKPSQRIAAVRTLIPVARLAIEQLITNLEEPRHNGGPALDGRAEAVRVLRELHRALGDLITAVDEGKLGEAYNNGLATEAAHYAKRAARSLRDDPLPYAISASVLAILSACGLPGIGGYLARVAISMKKR